MALLRHRDAVPDGRRFQMREKLASIGDDSWIEDDGGDRLYKVDGKALRVRDTFVLKDRDGREVATIQERKLRVRDTMEVERDDDVIATVSKKWFRVRDSYGVEIRGGEDESLLLALTVALDELSRD